MVTISNADAQTIRRAAATLRAMKPQDIKQANAVRRLQQVAARLTRKV